MESGCLSTAVRQITNNLRGFSALKRSENLDVTGLDPGDSGSIAVNDNGDPIGIFTAIAKVPSPHGTRDLSLFQSLENMIQLLNVELYKY